MTYQYKVAHRMPSKKYIEGDEIFTDLSQALSAGEKLIAQGVIRATILRADTEGINAGKFFLYQILR